ncbi:MAG: FkbM family methyltransferase [Methylobacteriaceae bacterium]|nr:FkbM family methyltransferase [Methylobacteriaceae bacterium]
MAAEHDIDLIVQEHFFADAGKPGVLVEVGAARPDYLSISESFRNRGWKIIAIEPNPEFCAAHRKCGHEVLQYACSDVDADNVPFYVVNSNDADYLGGNVSYESFSSLGIHGKFAELQKTIESDTTAISVNVRKLDTILKQHEPDLKRIDMLAVDVEGWELTVLRGLSFDVYQPKIVILENLFNDSEYMEFMKTKGYALWRTLEPNQIFVGAGVQERQARTPSAYFSKLRDNLRLWFSSNR